MCSNHSSVWALLSEQSRELLFGGHKDAQTLRALLDPATSAGIVVSDGAAVYAQFSKSQKCWAHLLRKAIKLTLQDAGNATFRQFADELLAIYRRIVRVQRDRSYGEERRAGKSTDLECEQMNSCLPLWRTEQPSTERPSDDFRLLVNELMRLFFADQLFTFVTAVPVQQPNGERRAASGTNNEAERTLRAPAQTRVTGRTSKTIRGARRWTIVLSVFELLRLYLARFRLSDVMEEIQCWWKVGSSCFEDQLNKQMLNKPSESVLSKVLRIRDA